MKTNLAKYEVALLRQKPSFERIVIAIMIIGCLFCAWQCRKQREARRAALNTISALTDSIHYVKLKNGQEAAEKRTIELTASEYKAAFLSSKAERQALTERIGSLSNLASRLKVQLESAGQGSSPLYDTIIVTAQDTLRARSFSYADKILTLRGYIARDSIYPQYKINMGVDIVSYWKKDGLFKPKYPVVNICADDARIKVTGVESYQIKEKQKFWQTRGFALGVGVASGIIISSLKIP